MEDIILKYPNNGSDVHDISSDLSCEYVDRQINSGLKIGDLVQVTRKAENYEQGWSAEWKLDMDKFIGNEYYIEIIDSLFLNAARVYKHSRGFVLKHVVFDSQFDIYWFPYFVLEKSKSLENKYNLNLDI